jgi:hypothetical protein
MSALTYWHVELPRLCIIWLGFEKSCHFFSFGASWIPAIPGRNVIGKSGTLSINSDPCELLSTPFQFGGGIQGKS